AVEPLATTAPGEVALAVGRWGFRAVAIDPANAPQPMMADDPRLEWVYRYCAETRVPVFIKISHRMGPDVTYARPAATGRVAAAYPLLSIVIAHGGWPYVLEVLAVADRHSNVYVQPDIYITYPGRDDYVSAANSFLSERLLYASSYPLLPIDGTIS